MTQDDDADRMANSMMHAGGQLDRDEGLNLFEMGALLWANRRILIVTTAVLVGLSLIYVFVARDWYRAEVLMKLADQKQNQGLLGGLSGGGLGGLASLAGLDIGGENKSAEPLAVLKSREFAEAFIKDLDLLPVFFYRKWDASAKRWKSSDIDEQPDIRDGIKYFERTVLTVKEDKKTGLITLSVDWTDPATAAAWADLLVERANDRMRQRAIADADGSLRYLKQELAAATVLALQQSIARVLEIDLQKLALANADKEYAFRVIDHAQVPKRKWVDHPHRVLIVLGAFLLGVMGSGAFVVARDGVRRRRILRAELRPPT
jgi:uncharacterized protein involved in exopolysaccharide biosynthesis